VGLQVSVPLFSGFSNLAKTQQAKLGKQQSILRRDNAYEQLKAEVHQVLADLQETTARIQTRLTVKETAQLSYDITQYRYARGVASRLELTDAELALTAAQSNYLEAIYDYLSARIALDKTVGRTGE
jgi:outer membrane protein TolC